MSDLISRQAAIDALNGDIEITGRTNAEAVKGYVRLVKDRLERLPSSQPEPRWIPVEDEPPKEKKRYWICTDTGYQCECRWTDNIYGLQESGDWGWSIFDIPQYSKVVAYMSLPKPYERSEE